MTKINSDIRYIAKAKESKVKPELITWKKKFPKKEVIKSFKKTKGRTPEKQELKFIKENKYFNPQEW